MIAVVRSEWLKLRTTAIPWVLAGIALVITGLFVLVYFLNHGAGGGGQRQAIDNGWGPPHPAYPHTVVQLRDLLGRSLPGYIFALLLGVLIITVEFRHKTVTTAFLVTPRRWRFVLGKLLMAAIAGIVLAISYVGGQVAQTVVHVPSATAGIFQAMMLFFILASDVLVRRRIRIDWGGAAKTAGARS